MKIKQIFVLLAFLSIDFASAQFPDLSVLEALGDSFPASSVEDTSDKKELDIDGKASEERNINIDYSDKAFSFNSKDFRTIPKERFFDDPLEYFGYSFFDSTPSTYAQVNDIPIPNDYILGPNDSIKAILFGTKNATYNLNVSRDGDIYFPEVGPITVAGLSFEDLKSTINAIVSNQLIGTSVTITLGSLRSIDIFVLGEGAKPGMYTVSALSSLTNAILKTGGIKVSGSLRNIQLKRNNQVITNFDLYDLLLKGDTSKDMRLSQGDVIFIPPITKTVGINGEVYRPAIYELKENENLNDLLKFSGSLKPKANLTSAFIQRIMPDGEGFNLEVIDLRDSLNKNMNIVNGDVLNIFPIKEKMNRAVLVTGHAQEPGFYPWYEGMRVKDIFASSDDLLSMTDINYALIKRKNSTNQMIGFLQIDLEELLLTNNISQNIALHEEDEIILFPSLLTPDQITTKVIQDEYILNQETGEYLLQEEWTSMTYLRKSLIEESISVDEQSALQLNNQQGLPGGTTDSIPNKDIKRYYEYSLFNYCEIPQDFIIQILDTTGYRAKKTVPLEALEDIKTAKDLLLFQRNVENERIKSLNQVSQKDNSFSLTSICRNQLIKPLMEVISRQNQPSEQRRVVEIFGNVYFPGTYPLTDKMVLEDAIKAAGGLKVAAYDSEIELIRSEESDKKFSISSSNASIENNESMQTPLKEMDIVNIKEVSYKIKTATITGEVFFAGEYPISENQTLSELIKRAGGITEYGSFQAALFQRESIKEIEKKRLKSAQDELKRKIILSSQAGGIGQTSLSSDAINQLTQLIIGNTDEEEKSLGRLVVDIGSIMNGSAADIFLEDQDTIHIPKTKQSVSVLGEVFVGNSHIFKEELTISDYIQMSGGFNEYADGDNTYLIKVDGSIVSPSQLSNGGFFRASSSLIQPGDTIVVPLQVQPFSGIRATTEVTQIIYQMALAAAAVNSF